MSQQRKHLHKSEGYSVFVHLFYYYFCAEISGLYLSQYLFLFKCIVREKLEFLLVQRFATHKSAEYIHGHQISSAGQNSRVSRNPGHELSFGEACLLSRGTEPSE